MDRHEFDLAKKHVEALLMVAKELCKIRQILERMAVDEDGFPQCGDGTIGGKRNIAGGDNG